MAEAVATQIIVYSDLNCPFCFTLSEWLEDLGAADQVLWHGIEHEAGLSEAIRRTEGYQHELREEVEQVSRRDPELGLNLPPYRPNSALGLAALVSLESLPLTQQARARARLYRALWREGLDISAPEILTDNLAEFGVKNVSDMDTARERVSERTQIWRAAQYSRIPVMVAPTGQVHVGLGTKKQVRIFLGSALFSAVRDGACQA